MLSFAVRLGYGQALLGRVCQRFVARVMQTLRRLTKRTHNLASSAALHPGVIIVVQRFRNDLGLFVHLHALVTDGCFDASDLNEPRFRPLEGLSDEHLVRTLHRVVQPAGPLGYFARALDKIFENAPLLDISLGRRA